MPGALDDLTRAIEALADRARVALRDDATVSPEARRWWVLVVGDPLDHADMEQRDRVREELRVAAVVHGLDLDDHVFVWDETDRAQLVAGTFWDPAGARRFARMLEGRGLRTRVVQAFDDQQ